jgi:hypothetical protein
MCCCWALLLDNCWELLLKVSMKVPLAAATMAVVNQRLLNLMA